MILFATHETCCLPQVPCTLCFIKDDDMVNGCTGIDQRFITEVVNILDECFNTFGNFTFSNIFALGPPTGDLVTSECFTEHSYERTVSRKKDSVCRFIFFSSPICDVQSYECLARSRNSSDKANQFSPISLCFIDQFFNTT